MLDGALDLLDDWTLTRTRAGGQKGNGVSCQVVNSSWALGVPWFMVHLTGFFRHILGWCVCRCSAKIGIEPSTATRRGTWLCSETLRRGGAIDSKLDQFVWLMLLMLLVSSGYHRPRLCRLRIAAMAGWTRMMLSRCQRCWPCWKGPTPGHSRKWCHGGDWKPVSKHSQIHGTGAKRNVSKLPILYL